MQEHNPSDYQVVCGKNDLPSNTDIHIHIRYVHSDNLPDAHTDDIPDLHTDDIPDLHSDGIPDLHDDSPDWMHPERS